MKSVYQAYYSLWPEQSREKLKPLLNRVGILKLPEEKENITHTIPKNIVIAVEDLSLKEVMTLVEMGFEHIVQRKRKDFPQELLASTLMSVKPESFLANPIPFFLSGFDSDEIVNDPDRHLIMRFTRQKDKETLLNWLGTFLDQDPRTSSIRELCLQAADEMISNALFNAPSQGSQVRGFKDLPRTTDLQLPGSKSATLFACFADERVVIGCTDVFGSLKRENLIKHLKGMFNAGEASVKYNISGAGAGLGIRYLIENSANFYVLVDPGKFTLMACGFLLKGLKSNLTTSKHIHFSCD